MQQTPQKTLDPQAVMQQLQAWAHELGFSQIGVADIDLSSAEAGLLAWLEAGFHGSMHYMASHGLKRARPAELVPGTLRVLTARMDYLPDGLGPDWRRVEWQGLADPLRAQVSLYARGRDYHKVLRQRLQQLADRLGQLLGPFGHRVFTDSAPVLEVELASRSGLGWRGKHTLTLSRDAGSMFFLGEIYVDLPLPLSTANSGHCGQCQACMEVCPTQAIVEPFRVDARRCISYLTIEHDGAIAVELRPLMGNRIYGCDDCQLVCPWNKFARRSPVPDFDTREHFNAPGLLQLWSWTEAEFLRRTEGSAIRRIGHWRWRRNLSVAMGNALRQDLAPTDRQALLAALEAALPGSDEVMAEHLRWACSQAGPGGSATEAEPR
ncbi:tRNA epoxyqueuosine(34) reductase QueG [Mitsuaria sp. WAJ17]|uniref:tRNA epoxyqueuosine(34) reductase QueG n=1 Tax=Mitsuaria sp. WAJ17 TaxID=2761452 RepID=UPI0038571BF9